MRRIELALLLLSGIALAASGYVLLSGTKHTARAQELEREVAALRAEIQAPKDDEPPEAAPPQKRRPPADPLAPGAVPESDLADQVAQLALLVEKLEQTAQALDSRITRSRLAVPSDEERKAQIQRGQARLEQLRKSAQESREKARQIAVSLKTPFDEKRLLEPGASPALEENEDFVAARDAAAAQERVVALFEKKLTDLQFATLVDAVPPNDER